MLENLKIALRRQKKILLIFLLTIFIPSVTLSIFGLRAIRNEQFRLAEQIENEHRRMADLLKSQVAVRIYELNSSLQYLAGHPAALERKFADLDDLISSRLTGESLLGQIIVIYHDEGPLFPLFQSLESIRYNSPLVLTTNQKAVLSEAEDFEYRQKNYRRAISLYEGLFSSGKDESFKAEMLANTARCLMRFGSYTRAIQVYTQVLEEFPVALSSSGLPLGLAAELQILECYQKLNNPQKSFESALKLYGDILQKPWNLNRDQYNLYCSMVEGGLADDLSRPQNEFEIAPFENDFQRLKDLHREQEAKYRKVEDIKQSIVPELKRMLDSEQVSSDLSIHRSLLTNEGEMLLVGSWIPGNNGMERQGLLAAEISKENFKEEILSPALSEFLVLGDLNVIISSLQGEELIGETDPKYSVSTITAFFGGNFPPWKMEFFRSKAESSSLKSLSKSFYFWTILTLLLILTFGAILISRTLSQEMEILKIKSDFVSSVSHELKTPLTSIKALIERLKEGKVKDSEKMMEYYSIISHDTEKLTRLVKNILDFSKIEEGKMEYEFEETDIPPLVRQQLKSFRQDEIHKDVKIFAHIAENIPPIQADSDALARAVNNLLNNAVKFSPQNPEIYVDVRCEEDDLKISVKDRGIGISEEEIDKIFDKFYQGKNALRQTVKGTGLGLTLVRHIAEAHGGGVAVESIPGQGSTFSLILPLNRKGM